MRRGSKAGAANLRGPTAEGSVPGTERRGEADDRTTTASDGFVAPPAGLVLEIDPEARLTDRGRVIVGGSPRRLLRLSDAGAAAVADLFAGTPVGETASRARLARRLLDAGIAHPRPSSTPWQVTDVTCVVPVLDDALGLEQTLRALAATDPSCPPVVIVDDGSADPRPLAEVVDRWTGHLDVRLVRRNRNGGPAAARNAGLDHVATPLVAFVDGNVEPSPGWLAPLLRQLADPAVALVAPRVRALDQGASADAAHRSHGTPRTRTRAPGRRETGRGSAVEYAADTVNRADRDGEGRAPWVGAGLTGGADLLERFDRLRSPLDLGPRGARVAPGSRVSYVPATTLVGRRSVIEDVGRFDERLRVGEDVDLGWRIVEAGHTVRYEPESVVYHPARSTLRRWMRQRFDYGTSAAALDARHPGAVPALAMSGWTAGAWGAAALGYPLTGLAIGATTTALLARQLDALEHPWVESARLAGQGQLAAWRPIAGAVTRPWWPLAVAGVLVSRPLRRSIMLATLVPPLIDWTTSDRSVDPLPYVGLRLLDDLSYGAGVWTGCLQHRRAGPLLPTFTSWPGRRRSLEGSAALFNSGTGDRPVR